MRLSKLPNNFKKRANKTKNTKSLLCQKITILTPVLTILTSIIQNISHQNSISQLYCSNFQKLICKSNISNNACKFSQLFSEPTQTFRLAAQCRRIHRWARALLHRTMCVYRECGLLSWLATQHARNCPVRPLF